MGSEMCIRDRTFQQRCCGCKLGRLCPAEAQAAGVTACMRSAAANVLQARVFQPSVVNTLAFFRFWSCVSTHVPRGLGKLPALTQGWAALRSKRRTKGEQIGVRRQGPGKAAQ